MVRRIGLWTCGNGRFVALLVPAVLLTIALFSRLYELGTFPFFQPGWPTCGGMPDCAGVLAGMPGIYADETTDLLASHSLVGILSNFGGGPVAALLIFVSTRALGVTLFAVRLPFALISAVNCILVYFTTKTVTQDGGRIAAFLSSIYFITMMPALIYGRMAFAEDILALLFIINVYCTIKISRTPDNKRWLLIAALSVALALIVKFNGIILAVYFIVFLTKSRLLKKGAPYVGLSFVFGVALPLILLQLVTKDATSVVMTRLYPFIVEMGNQLGLFHIFLLDTLPTGATVTWNVYDVVPEYWYLFLYMALGILLIYNYRKYAELALSLGVFVAFFAAFSGAFESYWLIMIQPLLAVAFGPGLKKLLQMPVAFSLGFYALLLVPLYTSIGIYLITPSQVSNPPITNNLLYYWNLGLMIPLAILILSSTRISNPKWKMAINAAVITTYFVALIIGSFFLPDLYPYYL